MYPVYKSSTHTHIHVHAYQTVYGSLGQLFLYFNLSFTQCFQQKIRFFLSLIYMFS